MVFCYCTRLLVCMSLMFGNNCFAERGGVERCDPPMVKSPRGLYCYDFQPNPAKLTWIGAQDFCEAKGGNLVTFHTAKEAEFVLQKMAERKVDAAYLGFRASKNRTKWRWVDDNTEIDQAVADWKTGEPNFAAGQENCGSTFIKDTDYATVRSRKILYDISCDQVKDGYGFICKSPFSQGKAKNRKKTGHHNKEPMKRQGDADDDYAYDGDNGDDIDDDNTDSWL